MPSLPIIRFVALFTGPILWAAHLSLLYAAATLACLTPQPHERGFQIFAAAATLLMIAALVWFILRRAGRLRSETSPDRFNDMIAILAAGLSILAMIWTSLPVAMIDHCAA